MTDTDTTELATGVPCTGGWKFIEAEDPGAVARWREARAAYGAAEPAWQEKCARHQRDRNAPRRHLESPYGKDLREASAAVAEIFEAMLGEGQIVFAGFRSGELGGAPEIIPLALLGGKRPRGSRIKIRGTEFFDVGLYRAETLRGPGRPTGKTRAPRDADDRLRAWLADVDHADKTIPEITAEIADAHPEILEWWAESTATKRVGALLPVRSNDSRP